MSHRLNRLSAAKCETVTRLLYRNPAIFRRLPGLYFSGIDLVVPAVQLYSSGAKLGLDLGVYAQAIELQAYR